MPDEGALEACRTAALRLLTHRRRSSAELRRRLLEQGHPPEVVDEVMAALTRVDLVNDETFAVAYVRDGANLKRRGRFRLRRELRGFEVDPELVDQVLDRELPAEDEAAMADRLAASRAARLCGLEPLVARRRLAAFLERRGLPAGLIAELLDRHTPWGGEEA